MNNLLIIGKKRSLKRRILKNWRLYLLLVPVMAYFVIFKYFPMYGLTLAFKEYDPRNPFFGGEFVGWKYFLRFFNTYGSWKIITNTLILSIYGILAGFPVPIILSLLLNEVKNVRFKKFIQTVTCAPHFISTVVFVSMLLMFLNPNTGIINIIRVKLGLPSIYFMSLPAYFRTIYVVSGIWKNAGWGCIVYMAALSSVDPELYEAGAIDGMNKLHKMYHIDFKAILPTICIMLILSAGDVMSIGFDKIFLMQNSLNNSISNVISLYVYNAGLLSGNFSIATAVGIFNSVVCFIVLLSVNLTVKRMGGKSLW